MPVVKPSEGGSSGDIRGASERAPDGALGGLLFIDGTWRNSASGETSQVANPATGNIFATVQQAGRQDIDDALAAADAAFAAWSQTRPGEREEILLRAAEILKSRSAEVQDILRDEGGSVFHKARFEVEFVIDTLKAAAGECRRMCGETMPSNWSNLLSMSIRVPLGIVAAIAPFNFPMLLATKKIAFAIAAGNCVILKPADETPVSNLMIAEIFAQAGLPAGVLNVLPGPAVEIGEVLTGDPRVKLLTFTGSTRVGRLLATKAARNLKRYTLELGGKNPLIVFDDFDLDQAVEIAVQGVFTHQGQICMASSRLLVHETIAGPFCEKLVARAEGLRVGDPRDRNSQIGPLIRPSQVDLVHDHIRDALDKGAKLLTGGTNEGNFFAPTVLTGITPQMTVYHEETFGPVTSVLTFRDEQDAIRQANDTCYGLSSAVLTRNIDRAIKMAERIDSGMVHINGSTIHDDPTAPFGGAKMSGVGREGGHHSIAEMTELKWITIHKEEFTGKI